MAAIESKDETVAGVFKDFYVIPDYQREYVWGEAQVQQLLGDIYAQMAEGSNTEYFIGSIVVCPRPDKTFDLIDGQQRVTTLFVILCAIRDHLIKIGDSGVDGIKKLIADISIDHNGIDRLRARLDPQYEDAGDVFKKLVDGSQPDVNGTRSMQNVALAYRVARQFLDEEFGNDPQATRLFFGFLTHNVKLIHIKTDSVARALNIFETINDRGVGLDATDLLKNLLFMKADHNKYEKLKNKWKHLTDTLHSQGESPLRFLRYYVSSTYGVSQLWEKTLYQWFVSHKDIVGLADNPMGFVNELEKALTAYMNFLQKHDARGIASPAVESISLLARRATSQHLVLLLAGRNLPEEVFDALCEDIESLILTFLITRQHFREFYTLFPEWSKGLKDIKNLEDYDKFSSTTLRKRRWELSARFRREFMNMNADGLRKYQLRYILGKLTQRVDQAAFGKSSQSRSLSGYCDSSHIEIEHILPQAPDEAVRREFGEGSNSAAVLWSIGNLTLIERSLNASVGRRPFSHKRTIYPKSKFMLTRVIGEKPGIGKTAIDRAVAAMTPFETWTQADVEQRAQWLTDLAVETWGLLESEPTAEQPSPT